MAPSSLRRAPAAAATAALIALAAAVPAAADLPLTDFESGNGGFWHYSNSGTTTASTDSGAYCTTSTADSPWDAGIGRNGFPLDAGDYVLSADITADGTVPLQVQADEGNVVDTSIEVAGTATVSEAFTVTADDADAQVLFFVGSDGVTENSVCVDNVSILPAGTELIPGGDFADGPGGWWGTAALSLSTDTGALCTEVPGGGGDPWAHIVGYDNVDMPAGSYTFSFTASAVSSTDEQPSVRALIQDPTTYATVVDQTVFPAADGTSYAFDVEIAEDLDGRQVAFQIGGSDDPWSFCVDDVSLLGGVTIEPYEPETGPRVRVNQVGYLTHGPKEATLVTEAADPVGWELVSGGSTVASGDTTPLGTDASAGLSVHGIDFSDVTDAGTYTLVADGEESYAFDIGTDAYQQLRYDALNYFYLARSGIEIDGSIVGADYARAAGHVSSPADGAVNQGDLAVPCQNQADVAAVYTDGYDWAPCDYTLDVVGGWYDAGDHGKYVVNGGIATAQLLGTFERTKTAASADAGALSDGTLALPETGNGVPDVLDEARWQLEFMLSMQVPEGAQFEGMVHHKIHDDGWTGLPLMPAEDAQVRELHRPSTAATLNLAATAAQGARLFAPYDEDFADELLAAARSTWEAALGTPDLFAPVADGADGGGPYDDDDVSDEFYWAAAELFLTTGEQEFEDFLAASPVDAANDVADGFYWGSLAALAKIDLATVPNDYVNRDDVVDQVIAGADALLATQQGQEFGLALADDGFEWGSNSAVLNNQVILGTAFDLTGDSAYADAVVESMDYLLGRNALNWSYITDYGAVTSQNQHSRWFANQLDPELPNPPSGSVAGGPNADYGTWDPTISGFYPEQGCDPQLCYVDHIQSWSTNEITVNWNSALSWVASWMADYDQGAAIVEPCSVSYTVHGTWPKGYNTQLWVTNTSGHAIEDWALTWAFPADDAVGKQAWSAEWSQDGAFVTATGRKWNGTLKPGQSTTVGFIGVPGTLADAPPEQFWINGQPCTTG